MKPEQPSVEASVEKEKQMKYRVMFRKNRFGGESLVVEFEAPSDEVAIEHAKNMHQDRAIAWIDRPEKDDEEVRQQIYHGRPRVWP